MSWTIPVPPYAEWIVGTGAGAIRIIEAGAMRITEDGVSVRVIERFRATWNEQVPPFNVWIQE